MIPDITNLINLILSVFVIIPAAMLGIFLFVYYKA